MKNPKSSNPSSQLLADSQNRLLLYATAAGVGAFLSDQNAEAQVMPSSAFSSYPQLLVKGGGTGYYSTYHYLDIDGDGTPDLNLNVDNFRINIGAINPSQTNNLVQNPSTNAYVIPWTDGSVLNSTDGSVPTSRYGEWLASDFYNGGWQFGFDNFETTAAMGFSFTAADGLTHYGYMNIQVNTQGAPKDFTATVTGIFYQATANAPITINAVPPATVLVTSIQLGAAGAVTINFTSSDNSDPSTFSLQSSAALGTDANWVVDNTAVITSSTPGVYQAVTTAHGATQFFRVSH